MMTFGEENSGVKRILCIIDSLNAGGAETFLMKIGRCTPSEICQFDFVVSQDGGAYSQEALDRGGKIYVVPARRKDFWGAFSDIRTVVRTHGYDCVLKLGDSPLLVLDLIAARLGGATRLGFRSCNALTGLSWKTKAIDTVMRPVLNAVADVKLAPSDLAAEFVFGKRKAKTQVRLLHNGVDLNVFRYDPEGRQRIRESFSLSDQLVIGHIGRFHDQKNHRFLLETFRSVREQRPNAVLLLVGSGEKEDTIRTWVKELGLEGSVIFAGIRFDIPQLLSAMDVFVFPSLHEGMPNTVIEAQATGLPCVIADTITREANITGLVTYLSLSLSPEEWAQKALAEAKNERRNTSEDFLAHGYDIGSVAKELISLFYPEKESEGSHNQGAK